MLQQFISLFPSQIFFLELSKCCGIATKRPRRQPAANKPLPEA